MDGSGLVALCSIDPITQVKHSDARVAMPDDGVLIVDGVFALRPELRRHWDLSVWVDIEPELSVRRGIDRDSAREGTIAAELLHRDRYDAAETIYVAEVNPLSDADVVVDNTDFDNPRIVRGSTTHLPPNVS
jgi:uridine kinase